MNKELLEKIKTLLAESEAAPCELLFEHTDPEYADEIGKVVRGEHWTVAREMLTVYNCRTLPTNGKALALIGILLNYADDLVALAEEALEFRRVWSNNNQAEEGPVE